MNVWYLNPYDTTPDQQATRTYDYAKELTRRGHKVTMFCSSFSHYSHIEEKLKKGESWRIEWREGVRIVWVRTWPYSRNDWRRALNMLSFSWSVLWVAGAFADRPDVIFGPSVPIFTALSAYILSKLKRSCFIFEIRDLWPQTLVDLGALSDKGMITRLMRLLERFLYRHSKVIITVLPFAADYIHSKGVPRNKIFWIPNGIDLDRYPSMAPRNNKKSEFTLMYIGGFSPYHAVETIIQAARLLQSEGESRVKIVLFGDGPEKLNIMKMSRDLKLDNIEFKGLIPKKDLPSVVGEADAFVAIIRDLPILKYGVNPNKLFEYMAASRPIIFAIRAKNNPVADAGAGITINPADPLALKEAIGKLLVMPAAEREEMGRGGRKYLEANHDIRLLCNNLEKIFQGVVHEPL